jgi:hypothetical protein
MDDAIPELSRQSNASYEKQKARRAVKATEEVEGLQKTIDVLSFEPLHHSNSN